MDTIISISGDVKTSEVKEQFSENFPGLKIEFFKHSHDDLEGSPKKDMIDNPVKINELVSNFSGFEISLNENLRVNEVEALFSQHKLNVQVFRKMGRSWIETTTTDHYTLGEQMELSGQGS
ncbi:hypothetical protein GYB22_11320 [bacterium]|nr:hypothetical protein [bacterium]